MASAYGALAQVSDDSSTPPASDQLSGNTKAVMQQAADLVAKQNQAISTLQASGERAKAELGATQADYLKVMVNPPKLDLPPPPEQVQSENPIRGWGSAALIFAGLASLLTRTPATTAMNAAAAAVNAYNKNDQAAVDYNYKVWEASTKNAIEMHNYQMDVYKAILGGIQGQQEIATKEYDIDKTTAIAQINATAHAFNDDTMLKAAASGDIGQVQEILNKRQLTADKVSEASVKVAEMKQFTDANRAMQETPEYKNADPQKRYEMTLKLVSEMSPSALKGQQGQQLASIIAKAIVEGKQPPDLSRLYGASAAVRAELENRYPNFSLTGAQLKYSEAMKQVQSLYGPQMTRFIGYNISVVNTINQVKQLADQLQLNDIPAVNAVQLQGLVNANPNSQSAELATKYLTAVNTLMEEFANIAQGGYAPTDSVWQLAKSQINPNYSVSQLNASLDEIQQLINYRLMAFQEMSKGGGPLGNDYLKSSSGAAGWGGTTNPQSNQVQPGTVMDGYRFKGGDPSQKDNWEPE